MNEIETINSNSNILESNLFSEKYCNICTENIETNKLVTLTCNPNHYFCYTCIFDWYNTIKHNSSSFGNSYDNKQCTCPICKKDGDVLPLLPPHTEPIIGIHVKGTPSGSTFFGFGNNANLFGGVAGSKCAAKNCTYMYCKINVSSYTNVYKNLCYGCFFLFKKGNNLTLENDEIFESPYIKCSCKMPNNKNCGNAVMYNKMYSTTLNNKKYYFCNDHTKLYNHGIQLTLNDDTIAVKESTHKMICCVPNNKLKYGYCLHKLDNDGLCKVKAHNKNKTNSYDDELEDSDIFGDSDTESNIETNNSKTEVKKVMSIHIGLCGATLKNGNGTCQNKGKSEFNGKCGKHKI